ncbi:MAG: type IX secretion system outer membrane channel protein PorV [Prevotellaceae bacterium]|nr:type IX secretion system outer membrane channel protein PorV [Prevotellaceae bacterium]
MKKKNILSILILTILPISTFAQNSELMPTLPALTISPDARSSAMGDAGVATSVDATSQHWNAAKYVFSQNDGGIAVSYTPWLRSATKDIYITYLSGFYKYNDKESLNASLRFFSLGNIDFYTSNYEFLQTARPNEFAFDVSYSRRLGKYASGAVTFRYINSTKVTIQNTNPVIEHTSNVAGDIAFFYQKPVIFSFAPKSELAFGATISNLGTKLDISDSISYFLPMTMRLGARVTFNFNDINFFSPVVELYKSLVPTNYKYRNETVMSAAMHGITSDLSRIAWILGAEYSYKNQLFIRAGYHLESQRVNNNSYITFGIGVKYRNWDLGASYLFVTDSSNTILDNTYRISIALTFGNNKRSWYEYNL